MTIYLFRDRPWTDEDSGRFLEHPQALHLDVRGHEVVIANGCRDGALLADVVDELRRSGATKIILTAARPREPVFPMRRRIEKP